MSLSQSIAKLEQLFSEVAVHLRELLPDEDPTARKRTRALMEESPTEMAALPTWFAALTPEQLDAVWVQAVLETMTRDDDWTKRDLALALLAVREHPNVPIFSTERQPVRGPTMHTGSYTTREQDIFNKIAAADKGHGVVLAEIFPDKNKRASVAKLVERSPDWKLERAPSTGQGGRSRFMAVRK